MNISTRKLSSIIALLAAVLIIGAGCATAGAQPAGDAADGEHSQSQQQAPTKTALGVRTPRHVKVALLTAQQLIDGEHDYRADKVAIVVCGGGVESLVKGGELEEKLQNIQSDAVSIAACGLTLNQKNIDPDTLVDGVDVVPNGIIELLRLQDEGYLSVEL